MVPKVRAVIRGWFEILASDNEGSHSTSEAFFVTIHVSLVPNCLNREDMARHQMSFFWH